MFWLTIFHVYHVHYLRLKGFVLHKLYCKCLADCSSRTIRIT